MATVTVVCAMRPLLPCATGQPDKFFPFAVDAIMMAVTSGGKERTME